VRLIDAEQIRELVAPIAPMFIGNNVHYERIAFMDEIDQLPKIEAEPVVHAHWIEDDYGYSHCSNCEWEWDERETTTPYCPNCGAKMDASDTSKNER
jgi:predicted RNA-binding Zn-ribbon protein involved in translation (DUF1610 family)